MLILILGGHLSVAKAAKASRYCCRSLSKPWAVPRGSPKIGNSLGVLKVNMIIAKQVSQGCPCLEMGCKHTFLNGFFFFF